MASSTFNPTANSGALLCFNNTYSVARVGGGTIQAQSAADARVGQYFSGGTTYYCYEYFLEFDLTSLTGATISGATLQFYDRFSDASTAFTIECRLNDHGASLTTADFVSGSNFASKTLLASLTTTGMADPGYVTLTDVAMPANLTVGTTNRMMLVSSRQGAASTPTGTEYFTSYYDNTGAQPIILTVTYTSGSGLTVTAGLASATAAAEF